jgi:hypothetical protein
VGGQALNFWAEHYAPKNPALEAEAPFTSDDTDFLGDKRVAKRCADLLNGRVRLATFDDATPNTGVILYPDANRVEQLIDFLSDPPFGLSAGDVKKFALPIEVEPNVILWVMHPVHCMQSRVKNVMRLSGYRNEHAYRQLRASVLCVRGFLLELLDGGNVKAVLKWNQRIYRFAALDQDGRDVFAKHGVDPLAAVVTDPRLPAKFNEESYARMRADVQRRRARVASQEARRRPG